jgi:hypothetical protein
MISLPIVLCGLESQLFSYSKFPHVLSTPVRVLYGQYCFCHIFTEIFLTMHSIEKITNK